MALATPPAHDAILLNGVECQITYLTRADWGGGPLRKGSVVPPEQFRGWALHHTTSGPRIAGDVESAKAYMRTLQTSRPDLGNEVPYSWIIMRGPTPDSCIVAEGRGRGITGAHTAGANSSVYAWSLAANTDVDAPTRGQIAGCRWIASFETPNATLPPKGHQQFPPFFLDGVNLNATACPGNAGLGILPQLQPPYTAVRVPPSRPKEKSMSVLIHRPDATPSRGWWLRDPSGLMIDVTGSVRGLEVAYPRSGDITPQTWNKLVVADRAVRAASAVLNDRAGPKPID
jgi:hypothetical protein